MVQLNLKQIHEVTLEILKDIDRVCRENDLKYTAIGGTLIGAVRHGGYIPWDDDIDIAIMRDDYERFLKIYREKKENQFELFDYKSTEGYYNQFAKVSDKRTRINDNFGRNVKGLGVTVDIFPLDCRVSSKLSIDYKKMRILVYKLHISMEYNGKNCLKNLIKKFIRLIFVRKDYRYYLTEIEKFATAQNNNELSDVAGTFSSGCGEFDMFKKEIFDEYTYLKFEDTKIMVVKEYEYFLQHRFGDYMKMPPEDQRISHPCVAYWIE